MKRLIVGAAVAAIAAISYVAISADAPDRPDGVSAKNWISVSARLGIVLVDGEAPTVGTRRSRYEAESDGTRRFAAPVYTSSRWVLHDQGVERVVSPRSG